MSPGDVLEQLYAADQDSFVEIRKRLERELRTQGRNDEAAELAALRKPTVPVFLANRLARERPLQVKKLVNGARQLSAAQQRGDPAAVRKAQTQLKADLGSLLSEAASFLGRPLSDEVARRLTSTLRAAAIDLATSERLRRGVLSEEVEASGFEALAGLEIKPAQSPTKQPGKTRAKSRPAGNSGTRPRQENAARDARIGRIEAELSEASATLERAESALGNAQREADRARARVSDLQTRLDRERRR